MVPEQLPSHRAQRLLHRRHLGEDVGAVTLLFHHPLQPADLAFDAAEPSKVPLLDCGVDRDGLTATTAGDGFAGAGGWGIAFHYDSFQGER
jgi:hypothetical protein